MRPVIFVQAAAPDKPSNRGVELPRIAEERGNQAVEKPLVLWHILPDVVSGIGKATKC